MPPRVPGTEVPLPLLIHEDMADYQMRTLRELIRQMGVSEIWLPNIFQRTIDGIPVLSTVDIQQA
jgi:hypothetical protein